MKSLNVSEKILFFMFHDMNDIITRVSSSKVSWALLLREKFWKSCFILDRFVLFFYNEIVEFNQQWPKMFFMIYLDKLIVHVSSSSISFHYDDRNWWRFLVQRKRNVSFGLHLKKKPFMSCETSLEEMFVSSFPPALHRRMKQSISKASVVVGWVSRSLKKDYNCLRKIQRV